VTIAPDPLVCPRCGAAAGSSDACTGCGLELAALSELPRRSEWEARSNAATQGERRPITTPSIKPLRHPTEPSRLVLALVAVAVALLVLILIAVTASSAGVLGYLVGLVLILGVSLWFGQQLLRARLLGHSVRVGTDTFPALQELLDEVRSTLGYQKRIDVYVVDKAAAPIAMSSYLGTRIVVIEGGLVADMLTPDGRAQLTFLLGRSIGALCAKHSRLNVIVVLLGSIDALKYVSPFLRPWYRATVYSGDQIGMACCSNLEAALRATRRLLVGKELADDLPSGNVLPQACLVQQKVLPRLIQLMATEPHVTNRYANLICFARYHDPVLWERLRASMPPAQQAAVDRLWQRSPYRRRVASSPPVSAPAT
jgi:Zn-dependent protease with chaperone function